MKGGNYNDDPPTHFPCGHPRVRSNMLFNGGHPKCQICSIAYHAAYRKANLEKRRLARKPGIFNSAVRNKPHLYPPK